MTRGSVCVRDVVPADADALIAIWNDFSSDSDRAPREKTTPQQVERAVLRLETDASERLIVAVIDERAVGVAHLRRATISPIHDEDAVHVGSLHVLSGFRRRGVGTSLLEAAAEWAEVKDTKHVVALAASSSRDCNRFLARLGLSQVAVVRAATVPALRAKLGTPATKSVTTNVIAARRLMRRARATS